MKPKKQWAPLAEHIIIGFLVVGAFLPLATYVGAKMNSTISPPSIGNNKDNILQMQDGLQKLGYYQGEQTGKIDNATKLAIQKFQKDNTIKPANGKISGKTLSTMLRQLNKSQKQGGQNDNGRSGYRYGINAPAITPYTPPSENDPGEIEKRKVQQSQSGSNWMDTGSDFVAVGAPPACPDPLVMQPPVDFTKVSSILYPGQYRGSNYKPHGGFRLDNNGSNNISIKIPFDATLINGSRYNEIGEMQYLLTFQSPCGIRYRFDHLLMLAPKFQKILEQVPLTEDTHTTEFNPPVAVTAGEEVATAVGHTVNKNYAFDFGVYDLRKKNAASAKADWVTEHEKDPGFRLAIHGICWFDLFPSQKQLLISLPGGDSASGKKSDYCL